MPDNPTNELAEKIARLLQSETQNADLNSLQASLEKTNQRLDQIEFQVALQNPPSAIRHPQSFHPSQEKFDVAEIVGDEIINSVQTEKACPYYPTGKPCDHCAMCSSRGF